MSPPSEARSAATMRPRRPPQLRVNGQARSIATICCTCSLQKVARRVGWPTEAFGSIRPSTHIFEPKGDSLPIDPAINKRTSRWVGRTRRTLFIGCPQLKGLLQVTADSSLWSTPRGLEVARFDPASAFGAHFPRRVAGATRLTHKRHTRLWTFATQNEPSPHFRWSQISALVARFERQDLA